MNVMVYNKFKNALMSLNIGVMKSLEGVYNVDEIIDAFANLNYYKMILDITAIRDYQNIENLQKLTMNINMDNVILLIENTPETNTKDYISKLVSLVIYNFTKDVAGINYLLVHPHTYRDVININNLNEVIPMQYQMPPQPQMNYNQMPNQVQMQQNNMVMQGQGMPVMNQGNPRHRVIGFKNATNHGGATTLIYMLKKALRNKRMVSAIEINKVDFLYFNDPDMISSTTTEFKADLAKRGSDDIVFIDLNDYEDVSVCNEVYYLVEPSTIMINKMIKRNKGALDKLREEKIILNKCMLSNDDINTFEYETKLKVFFALPCLNDRQDNLVPINKLVDKMKL